MLIKHIASLQVVLAGSSVNDGFQLAFQIIQVSDPKSLNFMGEQFMIQLSSLFEKGATCMQITGVSCQRKRMFYSGLFLQWSFPVMNKI